ncbi:MAG: hypothetical protein ACI9OJ_000211 [Myxococcota bacterium]
MPVNYRYFKGALVGLTIVLSSACAGTATTPGGAVQAAVPELSPTADLKVIEGALAKTSSRLDRHEEKLRELRQRLSTRK